MKKNNRSFILVLMLVCLFPVMAFAWPVPDTGQTKCYDNDSEIPCPNPGEAFYGQDSNYTINSMSYTKLDGAGNELPDTAASWAMIRDNVTGLIWENKRNKDGNKNYGNPHDADNTYTWYDSNPATNGGNGGTPGDGTDTEDFINALNDAKYGGHNDWRMPTIIELASIVDYAIPYPGPTINSAFFSNTQAWCWSSTTSAYDANYAWVVGFDVGGDGHFYKNNTSYVRAVRGGQSGPLGHLVINGDGTVTDTDTGIMWQQATAGGTYYWQQALAYAENLTLAGYRDWRLPTVKEQISLVDYTRYIPAIEISTFPDTLSSWYWSSTTYACSASGAWRMSFYSGSYDGAYSKNFYCYYLRTVRSGQSGSLGHLVISSPRQASAWDIGTIMPIVWNTEGLGFNVKISISHQGGKGGTFDAIIASTKNDGQYEWTITTPTSVNCVIKIEQTDNPDNWATEGLFLIVCPYDLDNNRNIDIVDIMKVVTRWNTNTGDPNYDASCDLDDSGSIDIADIMTVVVHWGESCE